MAGATGATFSLFLLAGTYPRTAPSFALAAAEKEVNG